MTSSPLQWHQSERENRNGEAQSLLITLCLQLGEFVRNNKLASLYWVAGTNRHRIGVTLVQALSEPVTDSPHPGPRSSLTVRGRPPGTSPPVNCMETMVLDWYAWQDSNLRPTA